MIKNFKKCMYTNVKQYSSIIVYKIVAPGDEPLWSKHVMLNIT
jgi:hypothetical protein